jgi:competence protein ComEC
VLIAHRIETENKDEFVVFSKNKSSLFTEKIGSKMAVHSDEDETQNSTLLNYATAQSATITSQKKIKNLYYFHSKKIVVLDSSCVYLPKTQPDVLVLIQSPKINLETLIQLQKPKQIVADRSNYKSYVARWKATCAKEKIPFHAIAEKGYYKMD